ncbi:glycosyltransferase family 9 protein [Pseudonocardia humida]|uniref:Glycosyltransferase family 9 protein n=1 Tax=Pseudonocardia humida TaxID=2800819 RepID=A0ABT0ZZK5_9PSEU|nr:glycosyltransferase family 9 protein [Pseudonocardia humida]MCO1656183.1 glycosyltransferase family 9 protein [Pseudonocardia humida]
MPERYRRILVVDLLGGLGDLVMALPVVHALARRNPGAALRVLTHAPGDALLRHDPAVTGVRTAEKGRERAAVAAELDRHPYDLVVSTTRYDDIPAEIEGRGMRCVTDLWRGPPPDEPVSRRYLRILRDEGLVDGYLPPQVQLTPDERARGAAALAEHAPRGRPVVLVPGAGMAVKHWPHWPALARAVAARGEPALVVAGDPAPGPWADAHAHRLPSTDLRGLAASFAAVAERGGVVVGPDTGPVRVAAAVGARTVGIFGPTAATRYGLAEPGTRAVDLQGLPGCPHRRPTAITEQVCWWEARCPLSPDGPACMADVGVAAVLEAVGV